MSCRLKPKRGVAVASTCFMACLIGGAVAAQEQHSIDWDPWVKAAVTSSDLNHRPGNNSLDADSWLLETRLAASGVLFSLQDWTWKVDTRAQASGSNALLIDDDNGLVREQDSDDNYFFQLREAWIRYHGLTSLPGEHLTIGLQRLYEGQGLWWDVDIESITWQGDTTQLDWIIAVVQEFDTNRTKADLATRDEYTMRWFDSVDWDWTAYLTVGLKVMHSSQNLDDPSIARTDTSLGADADSLWYGLHISSGWERRKPVGEIAYKAEWIMQQGDSLQAFNDLPLANTDIDADALDLGIRWDLQHVSVGALFTRGSGGGTRDESNLFSQTGIHSNRSRAFGNRQIIYRFNEAFRPDISNLTYAGVFASWMPSRQWEAVFLAGHYRKTESTSPIYVSGRQIDVISGDDDVGRSVDLNLTYYPDNGQFFNMNVLRLRAGYFNPGSGLGNPDTDYRITLESQFRY